MAKAPESSMLGRDLPPSPPHSHLAALEAASAPINPHASRQEAISYLQGKGWRNIGDPNWESSRWFDPEQPLASFYTEEPCTYQVEVREEYTDEHTGQIRVRWKTETRQVLAQDGRGGVQQAARRQVYHPKGTPLNMTGALELQLERDMRELLKAEEAKRQAELKEKAAKR